MDILNHLLDSVSNLTSLTDANGQEKIHAQHNIFGGMDYYNNQNHLVNHTEPNIFGGVNNYDGQHHMTSYTTENIFSGTDLHTPSGQTVIHSHPNIFGGMDFNNNLGQQLASTHPVTSNTLNCTIESDAPENQLSQEFQNRFFR